MFRMTPNVLENLFTAKSTRLYPTRARNPFPGVRGELTNDIGECNLCTVCAVKCPSSCIKVDRKQATWEYDPFACVYCGICVETCPSKSLRIEEKYPAPVKTKTIISLQGEVKKKAPKSSPEPSPEGPSA
jgi:formate hydrogenlyase subunit 6/NADH:ubiquinone oxidoreductase subunit I